MDSVTVLQNVPVKVVMTDSFRGQLVEQIRASVEELDQEAQRLSEFARQAVEPEFRDRMEEDIRRVAYQKQQLEWRIREAESVAEGAELFLQTVPVLIQLGIGDHFQEKTSVELVLRDWKVAEIRPAG